MFPDFATQAAYLAVEMKEWRAHMARVKDDEAKGVTGIDKHMPVPRPGAHPLVEQAVNERDEIDYEIFDDGPSPEQVLTAKKNELMGAVNMAELAALRSIVPVGKIRLLNLKESDIRAKDSAVIAKMKAKQSGILNSVAAAAKIKKPITEDDIAAAVVSNRTEDENNLISTQERIRSMISVVGAAAAQAHSDIEDLTLDTIDAWQMPDFENLKG
jgi:hypothetical protein